MLRLASLRLKILIGFLTVCSGLALVAAAGYFGISSVVDRYEQLAKVSVPALGHISGMRARARQIHSETLKLALYYHDPVENQKALESLNKGLKRFREIVGEYRQLTYPPKERAIFDAMEEKWRPLQASVDEIKELFESKRPNSMEQITKRLSQFEDQVRAHQEALLKLDDYHVELGNEWSQSSKQNANFILKVMTAIAAFTVLAALLIAFFLSSHINRILLGVADRLKTSADTVSQNSIQVSQSADELSQGATRQAEAVQETVSSITQIAAMTKRTAENSQSSLESAEKSQQASDRSQQSLGQMIAAISEISSANAAIEEQVRKGNDQIREIAQVIVEVGQKTQVIDDIVFQTKLLSFNASVEAARAGEHGKGFAVVAEEVSALANMSGKASREISSMLSQAVSKVSTIVESTQAAMDKLVQDSNERVEQGRSVVSDCKATLDEIIGYVSQMRVTIGETAQAASEQAVGVSEINTAMSQIEAATSLNARAAEGSSQAASQLMSEVENTREVVGDLLAVINGANTNGSTVARLDGSLSNRHPAGGGTGRSAA